MLIPEHHKGCYCAIQSMEDQTTTGLVYYWSVKTPSCVMTRREAGNHLVSIMFDPNRYDIVTEVVFWERCALSSIFIYKKY